MSNDMNRFVGLAWGAVSGAIIVAVVAGFTVNIYEAIFVFCVSSASVLSIGLICEFIIWRLRLRAKRLLNSKYGRVGYHHNVPSQYPDDEARN